MFKRIAKIAGLVLVVFALIIGAVVGVMFLKGDFEEDDDALWDDSEDDLENEEYNEVAEEYNDEDDEDELFKDDFALEDFQFAFDEDESDAEEAPSYEEADEYDELDLDSLVDAADLDFAIPRSEYQVPMVFEITLEELMEMTDEY